MPEKTCRICGSKMPEAANYCQECGRAFRPWDSSEVSEQTEMDLRTLEGLLHYHERMMLVEVLPVCSNNVDGRCATKVFLDPYGDAIKEAIRCIRKCHGID